MKKITMWIAGLLMGCLVAAQAGATAITGFGAPAGNVSLAGGSVIDFSAAALGSYSQLALGGVTISADAGKTFVITDDLAGSYNTTGRNLQNLQVTGSTGLFDFQFAGPVSAFGFNFGASNEDWLLEALDAGANVLESFTLAQTWFSNAGDYFGIARAGISSARLTQLTHVNDQGIDWILMDNFTFVRDGGQQQVPEPASVLLSCLGLLALAWSRRRVRV